MQDDQDEARWEAAEEGMELLGAGEAEAAIAELGRVISADPDNAHAHYFLGQAHYEREAYPEALACYVRALALAPRHLGARIGAGHTLRMMGEHERALRMGHEILALAPDDPDALYLLGSVHFQRGENELAHGFLQRFLETGPELEVALEVEGMLQILRGEVASALGDEDEEVEA